MTILAAVSLLALAVLVMTAIWNIVVACLETWRR